VETFIEATVECRTAYDYRLAMEDSDRQSIVRPGVVNPKGNFWIKFVIGAIVVFVVWFFFIRPDAVELTSAEQAQLLDLARRQLIASIAGEDLIDVHPVDLSSRTMREGAAFVSLTVDGILRGCMIDRLEPHESLYANVLHNVELAVLADERFAAIKQEEIDEVRIKISIVHDIETPHFTNSDDLLEKLTPFIDGVILTIDEELSTYLPSVWETFPDPAEFLSQLCIKAGWDGDRWRTEPYPMIQIYRVYEFGEPE